jgi:hypothetical protein
LRSGELEIVMGKTVKFIDYKLVDGCPTLKDSAVKKIYEQLDKNAIRNMFYNVKTFTADDFVRFMKYRARLHVMFDNDHNLLMASWITMYSDLNKTGYFNCALHEDINSFSDEKKIAKLMLQYLLSKDEYNTLLSEISVKRDTYFSRYDEKNQKYWNWFTVIGTIPKCVYMEKYDEFTDALIVCITEGDV